MYLLLPVPVITCYCLYLLLPVPATACTCYCLYLLLPVPATACACYCLCLLLHVPATACACYHLLLPLPVPAPARRVFPNCVAKAKGERQVYVGDMLADCQEVSQLALRRPFDRVGRLRGGG